MAGNRLHVNTLKDGTYEIQVIKAKRKSMTMIIREKDKILIRVPLYTTMASIQAFIDKNEVWIQRKMADMAKREKEESSSMKKTAPLTESELKFLTDKAKIVFAQRAAYYAPLVGVTYNKITIRHQRSRWGSCSSKKNLNFNCLLMLAPMEVLDSVVVHELCHIKEMNHSKRFYAEVYRVYPEYDKYHSWLKRNGTALMKRLPG